MGYPSDKEISRHVESAKSWLEKAERSFDRQASIKGELNLMLAEAEMKNLRKNHAAGQRLMRAGAVLTAIILAAGVWYASGIRSKTEPVVRPVTVTTNAVPAEKPQWIQTPTLQYEAPQEERTAAQDTGQQEATRPASQPESRGAAAAETTVVRDTGQSTAPVHQAVMTDHQVQAAVQDARHSLRGR